MISGAACGIAMGNGVDQLKRIADRTTGTNDNGGFAEAVDRLLDGTW